MGFEKVSSDSQQINTLTGGITSSDGSPLLDTDSDGGKSAMFGPAALREIQNGIANGDFSAPPQDASANINDTDNALPYWDFTDSSSGRVTLKVIDDATSGYSTSSGYILRASFANASTSPDYVRLERWIPVLGGSNRPGAYVPEFNALYADNQTECEVQMICQYYKDDKSTAVGTAFGRTRTLAQIRTRILAYGAGNTTFSALDFYSQAETPSAFNLWDDTVVPANAAYLLVTLDFQVVTTGPTADCRIDIAEIRQPITQTDIVLSEKIFPGNYGPSHLWQEGGVLWLSGAQGYTTALVPAAPGVPNAGGVGIMGSTVIYAGDIGSLGVMGYIALGVSSWTTAGHDVVIQGNAYIGTGRLQVDEGGMYTTGRTSDNGAIATRTATFSLANNTWTTIGLTVEDTLESLQANAFDVNTTYDAVYPKGTGVYDVRGWYTATATIQFPADPDGYRGIRLQRISITGTNVTTIAQHLAPAIGSSVADTLTVSCVFYLPSGLDSTTRYGIRAQVIQTSGGSLTITPNEYYSCTIQMARVGA